MNAALEVGLLGNKLIIVVLLQHLQLFAAAFLKPEDLLFLGIERTQKVPRLLLDCGPLGLVVLFDNEESVVLLDFRNTGILGNDGIKLLKLFFMLPLQLFKVAPGLHGEFQDLFIIRSPGVSCFCRFGVCPATAFALAGILICADPDAIIRLSAFPHMGVPVLLGNTLPLGGNAVFRCGDLLLDAGNGGLVDPGIGFGFLFGLIPGICIGRCEITPGEGTSDAFPDGVKHPDSIVPELSYLLA